MVLVGFSEVSGTLWVRLQFFVVASLLFAGCNRPAPDVRQDVDAAGNIVAMQFHGRHVLNKDLRQIAEHPGIQALHFQECSQLTDAGFAQIENAKELAKLSLVRVPITDEGLAPLAKLSGLSDLTLAHTEMKGSGLSALANLPIRSLVIVSRAVDDEQLSSLGAFSSLTDLELDCQELSLAQMPYLAQLSQLERLAALRTPVGENGLESLRGLDKLKVLELSSPDMDDGSISALNTLVGLQEAELSRGKFTNEGIKSLALPNLTLLSLAVCSGITDEGLANLAGMPNLEVLRLDGGGVSGKDFTGLKVLPKLRRVYIMANQFKGNDESIQRLKEILPDCEVVITQG